MILGLQADCESVFAGHQTFHPRFGWIKKAFDGVQQDQHIFNREDSTVLLGVGKNMVEAIKFWGLAFKVIEKVSHLGKKRIRTLNQLILALLFLILQPGLIHIWKIQALCGFFTGNHYLHRQYYPCGESFLMNMQQLNLREQSF